MPYSRVTRTAFGSDAIAYARGTGRGHNGGEKPRNEYTAGFNMLPDEVVPFEKQMQPFWNKADPRNKTQINRYILSFSDTELDPSDPKNSLKALAIAREFAQAIAPDHQAALFVQTDGKGGKLHVHILINNVSITDNKGLPSSVYYHPYFSPIVDNICQQYFDLAEPEAAPERINQAVRGARMINEQIKAANALEVKRAKAEGRAADIKPLKYIWQDDLRERIRTAAKGATDETDFAKRLRLSGVELVPHQAKDGTLSYLHPATRKQPAHYTYELVDISRFDGKLPINLRSKSHKLGANYQPKGIARLFQPQVHQSQAPAVKMPAANPPAKPVSKPDAPDPKMKEQQALAKAKRIAMRAIWPTFAAFMGWDTDKPDDPEEAKRRSTLWFDTWEEFAHWRVGYRAELRGQGKKLESIYSSDKSTGVISIIKDSLLDQFNTFLYRKEQQREFVPTKPDPEAERRRKKIAEHRATLTAELQRSVNHMSEMERRRQNEDREYDD